jgi:annexin A7/11
MNSKYEADAQAIRDAIKGSGTDEATIINITSNRSNSERQSIRQAYKAAFGRDLIEDLEDDLSGNFKKVVLGMYLTPVEFDVTELYEAFKGAGTDDDSVMEIIGSRNNKRLQDIKNLYFVKYGESLEERIKDESSGDYQNLLIALIQCQRDETNHVNASEVQRDVDALYKAGEGKWGSDEETFTRIFSLRSSAHLAAVNQLYLKNYGKNLLDIVESEFSGDIKTLLKTILHSHINPADYFATRIYNACKGWGTNDKVLIRSLITTDEAFMGEIKKAYQKKYGITLESQIQDECSGDFMEMLIQLVSH